MLLLHVSLVPTFIHLLFGDYLTLMLLEYTILEKNGTHITNITKA